MYYYEQLFLNKYILSAIGQKKKLILIIGEMLNIG